MDSGDVSVVRVIQSARVCSGAAARNEIVDERTTNARAQALAIGGQLRNIGNYSI
jgi:hypothetical protein